MKRHYILIWVDEPRHDERDKRDSWESFVQIIAMQAKTTKGIEILGQSVWLLPRDSGLPFVAECMGRASMSKCPLAVHTKFLDEAT
jgi:hypothetical protein